MRTVLDAVFESLIILLAVAAGFVLGVRPGYRAGVHDCEQARVASPSSASSPVDESSHSWLADPLPITVLIDYRTQGATPIDCVRYAWAIDVADDVVYAPPVLCGPLPAAGW